MESDLIRVCALAMVAMALTGAAHAAETVGVRVGEHDDFVRVVFDWDRAVGHRLERQGDTVSLVFDRALDADLDGARAALDGIATGVAIAPDGTRVVFTLVPGVAVTAFDADGRVAVDLKPGRAAGAAAAPRIGLRANEEDGRLRLVFDWAEPVAYAVEREGAALRVRFERAARFDTAGLAGRVTLARDFRLDDDGKGLTMTIAPDASVKDSLVDARVVLDIAGAAAPTAAAAPLPRRKPARVEPSASPDVAPAADSTAQATAPAADATAQAIMSDIRVPMMPTWARHATPVVDLGEALWPVLARIVPESDGATRLRLVTNRPSALAALVREDRLWLAFDQPLDVAVVAASDGTAACVDLARVAVAAGTALTCTVPAGFGAEVTRDGVVWEVLLRAGARQPSRPLEPSTDDALAVRVAVAVGGGAVEVAMPGGRRLTLVPVTTPGAGVIDEHVTYGYRFLATSQGVAVTDLAPGVALEVAADAVTIALRDAEGTVAAGGLLDIRGAEAEEQERAAAIADAATEGRSAARLAHAQSLLAADMAAEAWGQIKMIAAADPGATADPEVRALAGAILTRLGRIAEAGAFLDDPLLGGEWLGLWRCVLAALRGDYERVPAAFRAVTVPWTELGPDLRAWIGLEIGRALAFAGDPSMAQAAVVMAVGEEPTGLVRDRAILIAGYAREALDDRDGAAKLWAGLVASADRSVSAEARLALALAGLDAGLLDTPQAIEALEQLSFAWRGGDREWQRLQKLVDLYLVDHQYRDALVAMRTILTHIPEAPDNPATARRLAEVYKDVMIGAAGDWVPPLGTLAIFNEFQELTPVGTDGDRLIETLAERLAEVDLLAQAGDLLEGQLAGRLKGADRVRVAIRVAELRLAAGDAGAALDVLALVGGDAVPEDLRHRRTMAQAGALAALGRDEEAIAALGDDRASDAVWLVADMHWRDGAWREACAAIETLIARGDGGEEPWGSRADLAFRLALGYASAGDPDKAREVGRRYGTLFAADARRDMFTLITAPETARPGDLKVLPGAIAEVPEFEAFLAAYRSSDSAAATVPPRDAGG